MCLYDKYIVGIVIDAEGVAYIWNALFSGPSYLWEVDLETGEATEYCDMGLNLMGGDGHFDYDTDILYITTPYQLFNGTLIGDFGCAITCLAIPYDTIPPVTTHSLDPPEPDGSNGWYVSDVKVTLNAKDYVSGVKEIKYRVDGGPSQTIYGDYGTFTLTQYDDGYEVDIEYWAIDNTGHEETPHNFFTIDMDQTNPTIDLTYYIFEGNPTDGWLICFTATANDLTSGTERVEFFLNGELQETVYSHGPTYEWDYRYYGNMSINIGADAYDCAGNMASDYADPKDIYNENLQLFISTEDNNENEPDKNNINYDYAIISGYYQYQEHKGLILWRDVYLGAGDFDLYLEIDFYRFPDFHVHYEDFLIQVTADYLIWLTWFHGGFYNCKAIAFGNIEWG